MTTTRDVGDISTNPGGKTGKIWTEDVRASLIALWQQNGGGLINVAGTNIITAGVLVDTSFSAYADAMELTFRPVNNNTGSCTLNVQGIGARPLVDPDGVALVANSLIANRLTTAKFVAADDHIRLTASGGTTNVTVQGGIILQRSAPSRLAVNSADSIDPTITASQSFQCAYSTSRVIIEGYVSLIAGTGALDTDGLTIELLVDENIEGVFTNSVSPSQQLGAPFAFEYSPGDITSHAFAIRVTSTIAATYVSGANVIHCSEMSPNP